MKRQAREIALQILFQTEFTTRISTSDFLALFEETVPKESVDYADMLIHGIKDHQAAIDSLIQSTSSHWSLQRMSLVDRNILRICVFEMKFSKEIIKPSIAINEAVDIAKKYGATESGAFVNGILDSIGKEK
jgi:transcription antitermination protein NusB